MQTGTLTQLYFNVSQGIWQWTDMISFQYPFLSFHLHRIENQFIHTSSCVSLYNSYKIIKWKQCEYVYTSMCLVWSKVCPTATKVIILCVFVYVYEKLPIVCICANKKITIFSHHYIIIWPIYTHTHFSNKPLVLLSETHTYNFVFDEFTKKKRLCIYPLFHHTHQFY